MPRDLNDRVTLITGASLGVGLACARAFANEGSRVVLIARRPGPLRDALAVMPDAAKAMVLPCDVADGAALRSVVDQVRAAWGPIGGLVNNAGAHFRGPVSSQPADKLATMVDVNLRAPIELTRLVLDDIVQTEGFVVNVASLAGRLPLDGAATYSATKFGLRAFSLALREELSDSGADISIVSPGPVDTGFIMKDIDAVDDIVFSQRMCTAEHVADMVLDCARDGRAERAWPPTGARLATLSYLVPGLRRRLKPMMRRKGRKAKEAIKATRGDG